MFKELTEDHFPILEVSDRKEAEMFRRLMEEPFIAKQKSVSSASQLPPTLKEEQQAEKVAAEVIAIEITTIKKKKKKR